MNYRKTVYNLILFTGSFLIFLLLIIYSCEKLELNRVTKVQTGSVSGITQTSCSARGTITEIGEKGITQHGHCWSTTSKPETNDSTTQLGSRNSTGSFNSNLTGLTANTKYYVRAYAIDGEGTSYGNEVSFTTLPATVPSATTNAATNIAVNTATLNGTVNANGQSTTVTFEYGTTTSYGSTVTASQSPVTGSTNTGVSANISGLTANTTYHFRVKAVSTAGTTYGSDLTFTTTTLQPPTVTTNSATNIALTSATLNGTVNATGQSTTVTFEYGTTTSYGSTVTASQSPVTGSTNTSVSAAVTGLTENITYHFRVKAVSTAGTTYGSDQEFTTTTSGTCTGFEVTHTAGDVAPVTKTVNYGTVETNLSGENKCWITQNLGADNQAVSATDATEAAAGWYWQFNRKQGYKHDGSTRTPATTWISSIDEDSDWTAVNDPCTILLGTGWRIPTQTEWTNADNNGGWGNYNDTYASVLKLHAAGYLYGSNGSLSYRGSNGYSWGSMQLSDTNGWYLYFSSSYSYVFNSPKAYGFSVRCIRD